MTLPPVAEVVPHRPPMLLLDEVLSFEPGRARCRVTLRPDSAFMQGGRVRAVVALEYMGQAMAALAGLEARAAGRPPRVGFLLGTRELSLAVDHFAAGETLEVEVERVHEEGSAAQFRGTVLRLGAPVARAVVSVYLPDCPPGMPGGALTP
jgi:predicted hotdog family 3-hydroxylacyl-ACP dehydratase